MSEITISGKIIAVLPMKSGVSKTSGKPWASQQYVVETVDQYPKKCLFDVFGEDEIRQYALAVGDMVDVHLDINAYEWQAGKWFNTVRAWKVVKQAQAQPVTQVQQQYVQQQLAQQRAFAAQQPQPSGADGYQDLPF